MIEMVEFKGAAAGPNLLISCAIHGNEKCGTRAARKWIEQFEQGRVQVAKGTVRFLPICNPKAYEQNTRFIDVNLNRVIHHHEAPSLYEHELANEIVPHRDWASHVVDIHSYLADDIPFIFCESPRQDVIDFAKLAPVPHIMYGFDDLLRERGLLDQYHAMENTAIHAGKIACTLECGQNDSPNSDEIAYQSIGNYLIGLGMIEQGLFTPCAQQGYHAIDVVYKKREGALVKKWGNFEAVKKGEAIARYEDGEVLKASDDGVIFLPRDKEVGSEWYHLAVKKEA